MSPNQPFGLKIEFAGRGGEKINPASARVILLRGDTVNITQRLRPFISEKGIELPNAMVPPGNYVFEVEVSDVAGRQSLAGIAVEAR